MAYWMLASGYIVSTLLLSLIRSPGQAAARSRQPIMQNLREFVVELRRNNPLLILGNHRSGDGDAGLFERRGAAESRARCAGCGRG